MWNSNTSELAVGEVKADAAAMAKNEIPACLVTLKADPVVARFRKSYCSWYSVTFNFADSIFWSPISQMVPSAEARIPVAPGASAPAAEPYNLTLVGEPISTGSAETVSWRNRSISSGCDAAAGVD